MRSLALDTVGLGHFKFSIHPGGCARLSRCWEPVFVCVGKTLLTGKSSFGRSYRPLTFVEMKL